MVLMSPMRLASQAATGYEKALSVLAQKKNSAAADSDKSNRSNSQSASSDCTTKPPAKESTQNSAASLVTMPREGPNGALGACSAARAWGSQRYITALPTPSSAWA